MFALFSLFLYSCSGPYEVVSFQSAANNPELQNKLNIAIETLGDQQGVGQFNVNDRTFILMTSGVKNSGGYTIKIVSFEEKNNEITIAVKEQPPETANTLPVRENPKLLISIKKTSYPIRLKWS
ncbi:hypothetical protein SK3146_02358 [Paenibacillus konkukensis]|uniref:PrcB C-terminal domain-containing protein n=1 Tax=Paenibacillus konkukensis TaxID=2020716 RepID=A0ABY4RPD4_9BACL|nr:hypothetical protein SK3146_02358 [Paenibacillus konkukensis]